MATPESVLVLAEAAANTVFDEPEYVTTFGQTGGKDPWDDDVATDKDGWVSKVIQTFNDKLETPSVNFLNCIFFTVRFSFCCKKGNYVLLLFAYNIFCS